MQIIDRKEVVFTDPNGSGRKGYIHFTDGEFSHAEVSLTANNVPEKWDHGDWIFLSALAGWISAHRFLSREEDRLGKSI